MPTKIPKKPLSYLRHKNKIEISGESNDVRKEIRFDLCMHWGRKIFVLVLALCFKDEVKLFFKWLSAIIPLSCFVALVDYSLLLSG